MDFSATDKVTIRGAGSFANQSKAAVAIARSAIERKEFDYTGLFLAGSPYQDMVLSWIDGIQIQGDGKAEPLQHDHTDTAEDSRGVLLVALNREAPIEASVPLTVPKPGTTDTMVIKQRKVFGTAVLVPDLFPSRLARSLIYQAAWPHRGKIDPAPPLAATRSSLARLVEWRWLEREIKKSMPVFGAKELHAALIGREDVREALGIRGEKKAKEAAR